jgi:hypothetical protein
VITVRHDNHGRHPRDDPPDVQDDPSGDARAAAAAGDPVVDELIRSGELTPASNPGGVAALLAIKPVPSDHGIDSAEIVSEQRGERL